MRTDRDYFVRRAREERVAAMDAVNANARRVHLEMAAAYEKLAGLGKEERRTEQPQPEQVS